MNMKPLREMCLVKKGNEHDGYFVSEVKPNSDWVFYEKEAFTELVKQDKVQYLVYKNGIKCQFSKDELAERRKLKLSDEYIANVEKHYWEMDAAIKRKHLDAVSSMRAGTPVLACCLGDIVSVFGMKAFKLVCIGNPIYFNEILAYCLDQRMITNKLIKWEASNVFSLIIPYGAMYQFIDRCGQFFLVNTSTIEYMATNKIKHGSNGLVLKSTKDDLKLQVANAFKAHTTSLERWLGIV